MSGRIKGQDLINAIDPNAEYGVYTHTNDYGSRNFVMLELKRKDEYSYNHDNPWGEDVTVNDMPLKTAVDWAQ